MRRRSSARSSVAHSPRKTPIAQRRAAKFASKAEKKIESVLTKDLELRGCAPLKADYAHWWIDQVQFKKVDAADLDEKYID